MSPGEIRIEFTIQQCGKDDEFTDVGFGSSGSWSTVEQALHMLASAIQNQEWETEPGMPDPESLPL